GVLAPCADDDAAAYASVRVARRRPRQLAAPPRWVGGNALRSQGPPPGPRSVVLPLSAALIQPTTPAAASTARVSTSGAVEVIAAICTGFSMPISIGPMVALPASSRSSLAERFADCRPGMTSTFAGAERRLKGYSSMTFAL